MTSPRTHTHRYRIWGYCEPRGWDVTIPEIAEALDLSVGTVANVINAAGWSNRVRSTRQDRSHTSVLRYRANQLTVADVLAGRMGMMADA